MKSYARTLQHRSFTPRFADLWWLVWVAGLLGCSPAESTVSRAEAPSLSEADAEESLSDDDAETEGLPMATTPRELLEWIADEQRQQVATGRFLREFEQLAPVVDNMDTEQLRAVSWATNSSRLEAPVRDPLDLKPAGTATLRMVRHERGWRLENVTVRSQRIVRDEDDVQIQD